MADTLKQATGLPRAGGRAWPTAWTRVLRWLWFGFALTSLVITFASIPTLITKSLEPCDGGVAAGCLRLQLPAAAWQQLNRQVADPAAILTGAVGLIVASRILEVVLGGVLIWRGSHNRMAVVWAFLIVTISIPLSDYHAMLPVSHPVYVALALIGALSQALNGFAYLAFPQGPIGPRWGLYVLLPLAGLYLLALAVWPTFSVPGSPGYAAGVAASFAVNLLLLALVVYRYRYLLTPSQRNQALWVVYGVGLTLVLHLGFGLGFRVFNPGLDLSMDPAYLIGLRVITSLSFVIFSLTFVVAIVRHQLFDIHLLINRTLVYAVLSVLVVALYMIIVSGFSTLLQSQSSLPLSLLATGIIAAAFQPLRQRVQQVIDRLMFGQRDDPLAVLDDLGRRLEATPTPDAVLQSITASVRAALKLPYVEIEYAGAARATSGQAPEQAARFPLIYHAQVIGHLVVAPRAAGERLNGQDRLILENVARQASATVHALRLTDDLQVSRQRIITAREEERRRLRRDLHDGLGPALATMALHAENARDALGRRPEHSEQLLAAIVREAQAAIAEIRRVVEGLRPPALDDLGLFSALREQAARYGQHGLLVEVETPAACAPLPAAVEVALYRITQEALTNVLRHAHARTCLVRLNITDAVELYIQDDGVGLPDARIAGVGLNAMHERAAELGGRCSLAVRPGGGTSIRVTLPLQAGPV